MLGLVSGIFVRIADYKQLFNRDEGDERDRENRRWQEEGGKRNDSTKPKALICETLNV
jgi:hypothetical protein